MNVVEILVAPVSVSISSLRKILFQLLKKGKNVQYKLHFVFRIEPANNMMKNSEVIIESEGSIKSLMKVGKEIK
jgi:hypothetical protein